MSQENVDLVERAYMAFAHGDLDGALADFDPAVQIEDHERTLEIGTYQRREGFLTMVTTVNEGFEDVRYTPEEFTDAGTQVLVAVRRTWQRIGQRGRRRGTTVPRLRHREGRGREVADLPRAFAGPRSRGAVGVGVPIQR